MGYKHVFLCILIAHYLPTQKIPKTSGSQSVSVKVAWVLPVFHRHKNFCLWAEIKASTSNEQYLPFIRVHFPNLTQITTSAELAWKPFCWRFQRRAKVQDSLEGGSSLSQWENGLRSEPDILSNFT